MNKSELIAAVAEKNGITLGEAKKIVESTLQTVKEAVSSGKKVALAAFGSFTQTTRAAREGRNPSTGATIQIAAKTVVKFKAASNF